MNFVVSIYKIPPKKTYLYILFERLMWNGTKYSQKKTDNADIVFEIWCVRDTYYCFCFDRVIVAHSVVIASVLFRLSVFSTHDITQHNHILKNFIPF